MFPCTFLFPRFGIVIHNFLVSFFKFFHLFITWENVTNIPSSSRFFLDLFPQCIIAFTTIKLFFLVNIMCLACNYNKTMGIISISQVHWKTLSMMTFLLYQWKINKVVIIDGSLCIFCILLAHFSNYTLIQKLLHYLWTIYNWFLYKHSVYNVVVISCLCRLYYIG